MSATLRPRPTRSSLLPDARHLVLPDGIVATGFPAVDGTCREIGILFDEWQQDLNRCILSKASSGDYAADTIVMSIPRQVGKTFDVGGIVFADSIINPNTTTVWTAHRFKVSRETFNELRGLAQSPKLLPHIDPEAITSAAGNECIPFRNGSRILFAARERGAIRGFTKVRRIVLDEAQILTEGALSDMAPTMNQADNPQVILMGTPPKPGDPSEVFTGLRSDALEGRSEGVLYVEFSADPSADPDDRAAWREANPSYPRRTGTKAILRLKKLLSPDDFRREALGIWDSDNTGPIDMDRWRDLDVGMGDARPSPVALAVTVSQDRQWAHIGLAGVRPDGKRHLQIVQSGRGTGWVVERVAKVAKEHRATVALAPSSPAGSLLQDLTDAKLEPMLVTGRELGQATGMLLDGYDQATVAHGSQPELDMAVEHARLRQAGESKVWEHRGEIDSAPVWAVTLALFALVAAPPVKKRSGLVVGMR
jgi:hypothetical protein